MKFFSFIAIVVSLSFVSCQRVPHIAAGSAEPSLPDWHLRTYQELSKDEEKQLLRLVPQILGWASMWDYHLLCPSEQPAAETEGLEWKRRYLSSVGQTLEATVEIESEYRLNVYLTELGVMLPINRKADDQLESLGPSAICAGNAPSQGRSTELVISLSEPKKTDPAEREKSALLTKIEDYTRFLLCNKFGVPAESGRYHFIVPDFEVGDPSIYVVVKDRWDSDEAKKITGDQKSFVFWLALRYTPEDDYYPDYVKLIGLEGEVSPLSKLAEGQVLRRQNAKCQQ